MPPRAKKAVRTEIRLPVFPERTCREPVAGEFAIHSCEVVEGHLGPHASQSVAKSIELRLTWENRNLDKLEPTDASDPFASTV
ncbi:hypothetical protein FNV58_00910 (plasmid) [Streptomyces sp. RLB1-9]|uniref:hypothetical protein n=1 Tax=Streptomyces sp. RLB1-9 TaxID=2594454 RepID=UPI001163D0BA|nr:hypothetical protein [Streptomyces sp. RLB1-9]QDN94920.1 hypothetical protein FNV58_00910 [Streptomyces sp. RLB1-9]